MSYLTGRAWHKAHDAAAINAGRARRGKPNRPSPTRSATLRAFWRSSEGRRKAKKLGKLRSINTKKSWVRRSDARLAQGDKQSASLKKKWAEPDYQVKMSKVRKAQVTESWRRRNGTRLRKQWADPKWRAKMCRIRKTQSQGNQARTPNAGFYRTKYKGLHGKFWMRSGWEVKFALWLDSIQVTWLYEEKKIWLSKGHYYRPDFYLPDQAVYVELKGWMTEASKKKLARVRQLYPDLKLWVFEYQHLKKLLVRFVT
jgi:hypothetical protein